MSAELTGEEKAIYEWQMWVPGVGEEGQGKLKSASVLISRCGGVGGMVAQQLCAAGIGRLILAHGGNVKRSDLHRQVLMTADWVGRSRMESIVRRLSALNPRVQIDDVPENVSEANVERLVGAADIIVDCAPLFQERYLLNRESVRQNKPMVECAVNALEAHVTTFLPGRTPCLACLYPTPSAEWKRQFPVFGAVAGLAGCLGAVEVIKLVTGIGRPLSNQLLTCDLGGMKFSKHRLRRLPGCEVCGGLQ